MLREITRISWFEGVQKICVIRKLSSRVKYVLGFETSCDDTACAIVNSRGDIVAEVCESQLPFHNRLGGVVPVVARDLHNEKINTVTKEVLKQADISVHNVDAIAVTTKPGLMLSLMVGVNYAQKLALMYDKPLIPVHHMEAHALISMLCHKNLDYPFLCLLLSGGHAQLVFVRCVDDFLLLGNTTDCAPGEVFDKIARRLKLKNLGEPYCSVSGGKAIEMLALQGDPYAYQNVHSAVPLSRIRNCDFSFSGLRSFEKLIGQQEAKHPDLEADQILPEAFDIAASLQRVATMHILKRLARAIEYIEYSELVKKEYIDNIVQKTKLNLVVSGGVACNDYITENIRKFCATLPNTDVEVFVPQPKRLCNDNGVMIAWNGLLKLDEEGHSERKFSLVGSENINSIKIQSIAQLGTDIRKEVEHANIPPAKIKLPNFQ